MIDIQQLFSSIKHSSSCALSGKSLLLCGGAQGHLSHLFESADLTFGELKDIFRKLFSGEIQVTEKTDGQALAVTMVNGELKAARNKATLKQPMSIAEVAAKFDGRGPIKDAFVQTMEDLQAAFSSLSSEKQNELFENGKKFMAVEVIYPPTKNVVDYGGRCLIQFHGINTYDSKWSLVNVDKDAAEQAYRALQSRDALKQKTFEIAGPAFLMLRRKSTAQKSLAEVLEKLQKVQGTLDDSTTLEQYAKVRYIKYIKNRAKEVGLSLEGKDRFVEVLADRLNSFSKAKPTKKEINDLAKSEGIGQAEAKAFSDELIATVSNVQPIVIKPVEDIVIYAGIKLMKCLSGYVSADPRATSKKMSEDVEAAIAQLQSSEQSLQPSKVALFKKNLKKLDSFQHKAGFAEGVVFTYKGKIYKMTGTFGPIGQLCGLLKYS